VSREEVPRLVRESSLAVRALGAMWEHLAGISKIPDPIILVVGEVMAPAGVPADHHGWLVVGGEGRGRRPGVRNRASTCSWRAVA
jgi:hypothetical protein